MSLTYRAIHANFETPEWAKAKKTIFLVMVHIVFWVIFLSIPAMFNSRRNGMGIWRFIVDMQEPPRWANGLLFIIIFYFNSFIAIPKLYFRRRYFQLALCVIASFGLFFYLNYILAPPEVKFSPNFSPLGNSFNLFMFIITYAFSFIICLYQQYEKTKEEKLTTKISFLTAQINPHFLFNTLNSIYSLSITKSDKVPGAIVKLSGMMRYSVSEGNQNLVFLEKEVNYLKNYVELQKLRLTDEVAISFEVTGETGNVSIPPFLLIPFIENAFKHGINGEDPSVIDIKITVAQQELKMHVSNTKVFKRQDEEAGVGIGIKTTKQRLELLYPGRYLLTINDSARDFTVSLQIRL